MPNYPRIEKLVTLLGDISRFVAITAVLLIIGHYLIGFAHWAVTSLPEDPRASSPVYKDYPESKAFWKEQQRLQRVHFEPYYHWKQPEYDGQFIHIDAQGIRRTVKDPAAKGGKKIFLFGGSTLWGQGSPDESTIPSLVQSLLGNHYDVYNYGEDGFVSTQEFNYLLYQLALGNIPDAVIFYDGVNDGYAGAYSPAIPRDPQNLRMAYRNRSENGFLQWIFQSNYSQLAQYLVRKTRGGYSGSEAWDQKVRPDIKINASRVVAMYEAHIKQVRALAKEYRFKAFFFWQPNLFSLTKKMTSDEQGIVQGAPPVMVESQRQVYLEAKKAFSERDEEGVFFIGNVFDGLGRSLYWDWCHIGPEGNRLVADTIISIIGKKIEELH